MPLELKALLAAVIAGLAVVGAAYGVSAVLTAGSPTDQGTQTPAPHPRTAQAQLVATGHRLFLQSCASCHGGHAQGGDGPSLQHEDMSDAKITATITNGVKGQMPAFGKQYKPRQIQALVAYIDSLKVTKDLKSIGTRP